MADIAGVVALSVVATGVAEGLAWLLVYRTEEYKALAQTADRQTKKLDKTKEEATASQKKERKLEEQLKATSQSIQRMQFKSTFAVTIVMAFMLATLSTVFEGRVVAKLPFVPVSFISAITHRDLSSTDMTECSAYFIYMLASLAVRAVVQRYFNLAIKIKGQDFMSLMNAQASKNGGW